MVRLSKGGLLVVIGISIPFFVELRTALGYVGIDLPAAVTIGAWALLVAVLVIRSEAYAPDDSDGPQHA